MRIKEGTRLKDLYDKMDVILTTMDQRDERIMMAMEQREEKVKELEQTLNNISKYIKSLQDQSPNNSSSSIQ